MFKKAIVRIPSENMVNGITSAELGKPDYHKAISQHRIYTKLLQSLKLDVTVLKADPFFPDSCFVEDTCIIFNDTAVVCRPGAVTRRGEIDSMLIELPTHVKNLEKITSPGTLDGGDVMMVGNHFYIGISERTNQNGAFQLIRILERYHKTASTIHVAAGLHLKSSLSYLENNIILSTSAFSNHPSFSSFRIIEVEDTDSYAANSVRINDTIIMPEGYPETYEKITRAGCKITTVDVSEFRKLDGGLSCLSLRF